MNISHFHQLQNGQKGYDDLRSGRLSFKKLPETEAAMGGSIGFHFHHFIGKADFFLLDRSEFASDGIDFFFLFLQYGLVDFIETLQSN